MEAKGKKYAFQKAKRITTTSEFDRIFKTGKRVTGRFARFHIVRAKGESKKIGIIISRKIKGAALRNRYKRLARECYRLRQHQIKESTQTVALIFRKPEKAEYQFMEKEFVGLWTKADCLEE